VQVVRHYYNGVDCKGVPCPSVTKREPQLINLIAKQMRAAISEINREEKSTAGNKVASVAGHRPMVFVSQQRSNGRDGYRFAPPILPRTMSLDYLYIVGWVEARRAPIPIVRHDRSIFFLFSGIK